MVVVCLGTGRDIESEGHDRADLNLPGHQLNLLKDVETNGNKMNQANIFIRMYRFILMLVTFSIMCSLFLANGAPIVLVLFNAGPLDITYAQESNHVAAILEVFFPAQSAGEALYNVLTMSGGPDSVPAGRLPATWPAYLSQVGKVVNVMR